MTEMITTVILSKFVTQVKRKKVMYIVYPITIAISFLFIFVSNKYVVTVFIIFIRSLTSIGYFMVMMVQTESFPAPIQSVGAGSIEALAQLGSMASPLIIAFAVDIGVNKLAAMGVVLLICLIPLKFVPEPSQGSHNEEK